MKKIFACILFAVSLTMGFMSCSKKNDETKTEFFSQLELLVKKAENNNSLDAVEAIQNQYTEFFKKYPNITNSSGWTPEDTEKFEDLVKRFSLATVVPTYSDDLGLENLDSTDLGFDDLGLDSDLNFGGDALGDMILENLDLSGSSAGGADNAFGGLDLGGLSSGLNLSGSDLGLSLPDLGL